MRRFHSIRKSRNNERDDIFMNVFYNAVKAYEKFNNLRVEQIIASNQNSRRCSSRAGYGNAKIPKHPRRGTIFKKSMKFREKSSNSDALSLAFKQSMKTRRTTLNKDIVYRQSVETFMDIYVSEQKPKFNTIRDAQVMTAMLINIAAISANVCFLFWFSKAYFFRLKHRWSSALKMTSFRKKLLATFLQVNLN